MQFEMKSSNMETNLKSYDGTFKIKDKKEDKTYDNIRYDITISKENFAMMPPKILP